HLRQLPDQTLMVNIFAMIVSSRLIMSNAAIYNDVMPYFLTPLAVSDGGAGEEPVEDRPPPNSRPFTLTNGQVVRLRPLIEPTIFRHSIIPHITKLYCVHDCAIRMLLLQYLPHYGRLIPRSHLRKIILPQILLAIKDSNSE